MNNGFIDIHCHILAGLDEGASNIEESINMLQIAKKDGISTIVATPHIMDGVYNNTREIIVKAISGLKEVTNTLPIYAGAEVRICRDLVNRINNQEIPLVNDKRYLLLELPVYVLPPIFELENIIRNLTINKITPIFAHPERNAIILNNLSIMERFIMQGAFFQVTAMSISNHMGRDIQKATLKMIRQNYVHVVATDAHNGKNRPPILSDAYMEIMKEFGEYEAQRLFIKNPLKIIKGENIESLNEYQKFRWKYHFINPI
jgi:protein-tyrosine phosphatase